jgi:hypothetical protein
LVYYYIIPIVCYYTNHSFSYLDILVNTAFISVVPKEYILDEDKIEETIAGTFFNVLFSGNYVSDSKTQITPIARVFIALVVLSVMGTAASSVWR